MDGLNEYAVSLCWSVTTGGQDYSGVSQSLTFQPGIDELCTSFLTILGDNIVEPTERIVINLTTTNTDIVVGGNTLITILDDDRKLYTSTSCTHEYMQIEESVLLNTNIQNAE